MKKIFNNMKVFQRLVTLAIVALMVATTAVAFVFWKSGVTGAEEGKNINISIGEGQASMGRLQYNNIVQTSGRLIPLQRVHEYNLVDLNPQATDYVSSITYTFEVAWLTHTALGGNVYTGNLDVALTSIVVRDSALELKNIQAKDSGLKLFQVTTSYDSYIEAQYDQAAQYDYTRVTIKIELNEPADSAMYHHIANSIIDISFRVTVTSDSEA